MGGRNSYRCCKKIETGIKTKSIMYKCIVCGYIYDPDLGDPVGGIEPGTHFSELPDDYLCPICGASKDEFLDSN